MTNDLADKEIEASIATQSEALVARRGKESVHIRLDGLEKVFGEKGGPSAVHALEKLDIEIFSGEFLSIVGPSGCGKSTVLNILAGLDRPSAGRILIQGKEMLERRGHFGYMFQRDLLFPWRTIAQNVALGLEIRGVAPNQARQSALELLHKFGLAQFSEKYASQLSGGMRQRVALMRTLICDSECLLLDEPFGALDALTRSVMQSWLLGIWEKQQQTVVFITHDIEEAVFLSDRVLTMSARPGRIKGEFKIDLDRPRRREMLTSEKFTRLKKLILEQIYDESLIAEELTSGYGKVSI